MRRDRVHGSPRQGLSTATLGFFVGFAGVVLFGPVAEEFETAMGLSGLLLGLLAGSPQLFGSLLRVPFGAWVEDVGARKPFLVLLGLSVVGMAGLAVTLVLAYPDDLGMRHYPLVFLFGALSGCGIATFSVGIAQTSYWYPAEKQGSALALYAGLSNSSPGIFTLLLPIALVALGLTGAYLAWLAFLVVGTIVYAALAVDAPSFQLEKRGVDPNEAERLARSHGQELFPTGNATESIREAAGDARTWALVALYFTSFGGFLALTVWLPSYWTSLHGLDLRTAGALTAIAFTLFATFVRIPGGLVSDRVGGERTAIASFLAVGLAAITLVFTRDVAVALLATMVLGGGMGVANAAVFQLVPTYVPKAVGGASGLVGGLGAFGGFVVPPILGGFVDVYGVSGYATGFVVYVGLSIAAIVLSGLLYRGRSAVSPG